MSEELEDVDEPQMQSGSEAYWDTVQSENEVDDFSVPLQVRLDCYMLGPSLSHDQLFSIVDFSPNWAYENSEIMAGRVPFYVTCSNMMVCSELREFEYRVAQTQDVDSKDYFSYCSNKTLEENSKAGKHDEHADAAAIQIQNKFCSWKCRKDFLIIRQQIVKIRPT
ncbi:hypothetical protein RchiOBHm_Chr2g0113341 [Rosa chinensis]|uniref:Uncharacterized protein n=1 Tax=Rosa chinensis TaxID=74649 RepID=A0A2P6RQF2_ROSCH|nr:hypothetical protein RchiOBHm_Chr2g0113341 [Rosa chinensis]